jgi:hypothetical protein
MDTYAKEWHIARAREFNEAQEGLKGVADTHGNEDTLGDVRTFTTGRRNANITAGRKAEDISQLRVKPTLKALEKAGNSDGVYPILLAYTSERSSEAESRRQAERRNGVQVPDPSTSVSAAELAHVGAGGCGHAWAPCDLHFFTFVLRSILVSWVS